MEYYAVAGMVVLVLVAVVGFYVSMKKNIKEELKPMEDLNVNIIRLNANFEHMLENDEVRDKRIEKHGKEIDKIKEQQILTDKILDRHEQRLDVIEKNKRRKKTWKFSS